MVRIRVHNITSRQNVRITASKIAAAGMAIFATTSIIKSKIAHCCHTRQRLHNGMFEVIVQYKGFVSQLSA